MPKACVLETILDNKRIDGPDFLVPVSHSMANTIPCPNPMCTHSFSMAELQAATQLLCPKCGFRMQGKGSAAPPPAALPAKPPLANQAAAPSPAPAAVKAALEQRRKLDQNQPVPKPAPAAQKAAPPIKPAVAKPIATPAPAKVAMATPVPASAKPASAVAAASPPMATPIATGEPPPAAPPADESLPDEAFFNPDFGGGTGTLVRTGAKPKKKFNWMRLLVISFAVGFAICVVVIAVGFVINFFGGVQALFSKSEGDTVIGTIRNAKNESEEIYKLVLPKKDWSPDTEVKRSLKAHTAWRHNTQDFWFALVVKDYGMVKPRDAEMLREGIEKLEEQFGPAMELAKMAESVKFGALTAQKLQFAGIIREARWLGECYMFFNSGIAYWLFIASPDGADIERFGAELPEKNIFTISERRGWREQPVPVVTFASDNAKIEMTAPKEVWEKAPNSKDDYETGELFLFGVFLDKKDNRKNASLHVIRIAKKENLVDAVKAAQEVLDAKVKADNKDFKIVHAADAADTTAGQKEMGEVTDVGNRRGRMIDLKLQENEKPIRYYLVAVINESDGGYAILCECAWDSRQIWRQDFLDILRSLRVK